MEQDTEAVKKSGRLRRVMKWMLRLCLVFALLPVIGILLLVVYENEVKAAILGELNKHLKVQVQVKPDNIDLTFMRSFPHCSLRFADVLVLGSESTRKKDTLLYSKDLSLQFNLLDLWNKKYNIRTIKISDAKLNMRVFTDGSCNYDFWKSEVPAAKNSSTSFELEKVIAENLHFIYKNSQVKFKMDVLIHDAEFKGHFNEENYDLIAKMDFYMHEMQKGKTVFLRKKKMMMDVDFAVNGDQYSINRSKFRINDLNLALKGRLNYAGELEKINLQIDAPDLSIAPVLSLLPADYTEFVKDYQSEGKLYLRGSYAWKKSGSYVLKGDFGIGNASITYRPNAAVAKQVNLDGNIVITEKSSSLDLRNVTLNLKEGQIAGNCKISDFSRPFIDLDARANVNLNSLFEFWPLDTLQSVEGRLQLDTKISGLTENLKVGGAGKTYSLDLNVLLNDLVVKFKADDEQYRIPSCELSAMNGDITVKKLALERGVSRLSVSGSIPGLFSYIMDKDAPLVIRGSLDAPVIRLEDFMGKSPSSGSNSGTALIPANMSFVLDARIGSFRFGKFTANEISGDIEIRDQQAIINEVSLKAVGGTATVNAFADNSKNRLDLTLQSNIQQIDIKSLFEQMNNFGQTVLDAKHLKGTSSATLEVSARWNNKLEVDEKSITASCDVVVENGELNNFEPMMALSKYVNIEDLSRIRFNTLQSNIRISNRVITVPATHISNSALDIDFWGTHTFDNNIDYHIRLVISELLNKKRRNRESEFGPLENDTDKRRMAHILMKGTLDSPKIAYDKKGMKEKIKMDVKQEKSAVKQILREEFGLFKKDSLAKKKSATPAFELEENKKPTEKKSLELKKKPESEEDF